MIVLLDRAESTRFEGFPERFVAALMDPRWPVCENEVDSPGCPSWCASLENIFANTVRTIVAILEEYRSERRIREAFQAFWSYQLAGLAGLQKWVSND